MVADSSLIQSQVANRRFRFLLGPAERISFYHDWRYTIADRRYSPDPSSTGLDGLRFRPVVLSRRLMKTRLAPTYLEQEPHMPSELGRFQVTEVSHSSRLMVRNTGQIYKCWGARITNLTNSMNWNPLHSCALVATKAECFHQLLTKMARKLRPPIILIGNYRSGTSITQNLIGLHPGIVTWYEPRTLWLYADPGRRHDEFDADDATDKVVRYIRNRFLKYQERHHGRQIMEKTPANILKVPYVNAIFPEATYLYIIRNPFSVISSMEHKWQRTKTLKGIRRSLASTPIMQLPYYARHLTEDLVRKKILRQKYISRYGPRYKGMDADLIVYDKLRVIARQWAISSRKAREDLANLDKGRVFSFRYEDLMESPEVLFRRIYDHCDLEYNDDMLRMANKMVDPSRQQKWLRLDPQRLGPIIPEVKAEMDAYGYELPDSLR